MRATLHEVGRQLAEVCGKNPKDDHARPGRIGQLLTRRSTPVALAEAVPLVLASAAALMGLARTAAVRGRRLLGLAACMGLVAVGVLAAAISPALGSAPRSRSVGTGFDPASVTFVSLPTGWALGTVRCAEGACLALRETTNAGRSWSARPLPASLIAAADRRRGGVLAGLYGGGGLNVRFADLRDGWIYGGLAVPARQGGVAFVAIEPTLWSTHDGGLIWRKQPLPDLGRDGPIFDLEAAAGSAYLMASNNKAGRHPGTLAGR